MAYNVDIKTAGLTNYIVMDYFSILIYQFAINNEKKIYYNLKVITY